MKMKMMMGAVVAGMFCAGLSHGSSLSVFAYDSGISAVDLHLEVMADESQFEASGIDQVDVPTVAFTLDSREVATWDVIWIHDYAQDVQFDDANADGFSSGGLEIYSIAAAVTLHEASDRFAWREWSSGLLDDHSGLAIAELKGEETYRSSVGQTSQSDSAMLRHSSALGPT